MESKGTQRNSSESFVPVSVPDPGQTGKTESEENPADIDGKEETTPYDGEKEIVKALEVLERDSAAIAGSFTSLFSSLRLVLSQVTNTSVDHMNCFSDAAAGLQECVLDAATKGNRYINSCLRLNEELKGIESLATQLNVAIKRDTLIFRFLDFYKKNPPEECRCIGLRSE